MADTGVVALWREKSDQKNSCSARGYGCFAIREQNEVTYKSTNEGVMHACGHDVHTASLLGTAVS
jgi:metal-dependent amidase/aminoacylase/carboxypeptidase family protein